MNAKKTMLNKIIVFFLLFLSHVASASSQDESMLATTGRIEGAILQTQLERQALAFAASVIPKFEKEYISGLKKNGHLAFAPDIRLQTGGNDSFQSLTLKGVGYFFFGKEGTGPAPKGKRPLPTYTDGGFVIPISGGGKQIEV